MKMTRVRLVVGLLAALLVWRLGAAVGPYLAHFDMLGMLREIDRTNRAIGAVNAGILTTLGGVRQQAEGVDRVSARLGRLHDLLGRQQVELAQLQTTGGEQAALSQDLQTLTAAVVPATAGLAASANAEAATLERMDRNLSVLAYQLSEITGINRSTLSRLRQAEELSGLILERMP